MTPQNLTTVIPWYPWGIGSLYKMVWNNPYNQLFTSMDSQPWMEIAVFDMQLGESKMWNPGYTVSYLYIYWKKIHNKWICAVQTHDAQLYGIWLHLLVLFCCEAGSPFHFANDFMKKPSYFSYSVYHILDCMLAFS